MRGKLTEVLGRIITTCHLPAAAPAVPPITARAMQTNCRGGVRGLSPPYRGCAVQAGGCVAVSV